MIAKEFSKENVKNDKRFTFLAYAASLQNIGNTI
jgi:hypothetical protein